METLWPAQRVQQLEEELTEVRGAFEDYVASSKELEKGLDEELTGLQTKLLASTKGNDVLESQMQRMAPMVAELQAALEISRKKLNEESRLRRRAEATMETSMGALREENEALQSKCDTLTVALESKSQQVEEMKLQREAEVRELEEINNRIGKEYEKGLHSKPSESRSEVASKVSDDAETKDDASRESSYDEVADDLETVKEKLVSSQLKLWRTESSLRASEARVQELQSGNTTEIGAKNISLLDLAQTESEVAAPDTTNLAEQSPTSNPEQEQGKLDNSDENGEVDPVDVTLSWKSQMERLKFQVEHFKLPAELKHDIQKYQVLLGESEEQNSTLVEEIACLREVLQDNADREEKETELSEQVRSSVMAEANKKRETELGALREKFKKLFKENSTLQQRVDQLENGVPTAFVRKEEVAHLKKEISSLREAQRLEKENSAVAMVEAETSWKEKLEKTTADAEEEKYKASARIRQEMRDEADEILRTLRDQMEETEQGRDELQDVTIELREELKVAQRENVRRADEAKLADGNVKAARDEILSLKKKCGILRTDLDHAVRSVEKLEVESKDLRQRYGDARAELEVAQQVLEDTGLSGNMLELVDAIGLKRQIHTLSEALDQVNHDYADLENDYLDSQHRFCDAQEEAVRKSEDEIIFLNNRIVSLEESLANTKSDHAEMSRQLSQARKEMREAQREGERKGREAVERGLKARQAHERQIVMSKFEDMSEEKDSLEKRLAEADVKAVSAERELEEVKAALKTELTDYRKALECSQIENEILKEGRSDEITGTKNVRVVGEPFGIETVDTMMDSDAGSDDHSDSTGDETQQYEEDLDDVDRLRSQLQNATRENMVLKTKILSKGSSELASYLGGSSSSEETQGLREEIKILQDSLENTENRFERLNELSTNLKEAESNLVRKEADLKATKLALESSEEESRSLQVEVEELKGAIREAQEKMSESVSHHSDASEFKEIRDQLRALAEEKAALQHQVDDSKIALSVSQYAQERNKEELRDCEMKLGASMEDVYSLKSELKTFSHNYTDLKGAYEALLDELDLQRREASSARESEEALDTLSSQMDQLVTDNDGLQQIVVDLEEALSIAQHGFDQKCGEVKRLQKTLTTTKEETRLLTNEISNLGESLETAKTEYEAVVDELEAVNELFDEAGQRAEGAGEEMSPNGGDTAENRLQRVADESNSLREKLRRLELALNVEQSQKVQSVELESEAHILKEALRASEEEARVLRENEHQLTVSLKEVQHDLRQTKMELELAEQSFESSLRQAERTARASAVDELRQGGERKEDQLLREQMRKLIDTSGGTVVQAGGPSKSHEDNSSERRRLEAELHGMCESLEKVIYEKAVIEEELDHLRVAFEEAKSEGERQGRLEATKGIQEELNQERAQEMNEFKREFSELVQENSDLHGKCKEVEIALAISKDSQQKSRVELDRLEAELSAAKFETFDYQQQVLTLTQKLESVDDRDKLRLSSSPGAPAELRMSVEEATSNKLADLKDELLSKSSQLRSLKSEKDKLALEKASVQRRLNDVEAKLARESSSRVDKEEEVDELSAQLRGSKEETASFKLRVSQLNRTLKESTKQLDKLREQFDLVCTEAATKQSKEAELLRSQLETLAEEKATLMQEVDEAKISLSLQKFKQSQSTSGAQDTEGEQRNQLDELATLRTEIVEARHDIDETLKVLEATGEILNSVEGAPVQATSFTRAKESANAVKTKVSHLVSTHEEAREENAELKVALVAEAKEISSLEKMVSDTRTALEGLKTNEQKDIEELSAENATLTEEVKSLRQDLAVTENKKETVEQELATVKEYFANAKGSKDSDNGNMTSSGTGQNAEMRLLQDQFKKLSARSIGLGNKVADAESAVEALKAKQEDFSGVSEARRKQVEEMENTIQQAVLEQTKRDDELSTSIENRVSTAEGKISEIDQEFSNAKSKLQVSEAGLVVVKNRRGKEKPKPEAERPTARPMEEPMEFEVMEKPQDTIGDEESTIQSLEQAGSESRDDGGKIPTEPLAPPPPPPQAVRLEGSTLASRALEAIARTKRKNSLRRLDVSTSLTDLKLGSTKDQLLPTSTKAGVNEGSARSSNGERDVSVDNRE